MPDSAFNVFDETDELSDAVFLVDEPGQVVLIDQGEEDLLSVQSAPTISTHVDPRQRVSPSVSVLARDSTLHVSFYSDVVCRSICAYDSDYNPFRTAPLWRLNSSVLAYTLSRYIIIAYLSAGSTNGGELALYCYAKAEVVSRIDENLADGTLVVQSQKNELLLSIIMYGMTTSWDGSSDLGIKYYNMAVTMLASFERCHPNTRKFFWQTLVYWWCNLSYISDTKHGHAAGLPVLRDASPLMRRIQDGKCIPHPLVGLSPDMFLLMGQVGSLVYTSRMDAFGRPFVTMAHIKSQHAALEEARSIDKKLWDFVAPDITEYVDDDDRETPIEDLVRMTQVYCIAALLTLYKCFPDLLAHRLGFRDATEDMDDDQELRQQTCEAWRQSCALHALYLLSRNTPNSGTQSVEQVLLVVISGEMRDYSGSDVLSRLSGSSLLPGFIGPLTSTYAQDELSCMLQQPLQTATSFLDTSPDFIDFDMLFNSANPLTTKNPREQLLDRLAKIRERLPYRSIAAVEMLMHEMWSRLDQGLDAFWIDVMIENNWRFFMG